MNRVDIVVTNGGSYRDITKIDDKDTSSFESEKALGEYLLGHPLVKLSPVSEYSCAVIATKHISSINFR